MNDHDFELLSQYIDGELDQLASRRLEQRLRAEPSLAATLAELQGQDHRLRSALSGTEQVPARVSALLEQHSNVVAMPRRTARPAWHYAVAASLIAAVGLVLTPSWQQAPSGGQMLAEALETSPSMADGWLSLEDGRQVRPVLSFQDVDGQWCREYLVLTQDQGERGVACREGNTWQTMVIAQAHIPGDNGDYRPAGAGDSDKVAEFLAERARDIALSAAEEAQQIENHWK